MIADVNGSSTSFNLSLQIDTSLTSTYLSYLISGHKTTADGLLVFNLLNYNKSLLVPGIYTGMNQLNLYVAYHSLGKEYDNIGFQGFTVEITNVTNSSVSGNFHGVVKYPYNQTDSIVISNGHFNARIIY